MDTITKQMEINRLGILILDLCLKAAKVAIKPRSKYKATRERRLAKIISIKGDIASLKNQIHIVKSHPDGSELWMKKNK